MSVKDHPVMARLVQYQKVTLCFILLVSLQQVIPMKYGVEAACLNCLDAGIKMSYSVVPLSSPAGFVSLLHGSSAAHENSHQAPVVQTMDSAVHRINHYPADKH